MTRQKGMPPKSKGTERILYQKHILFTLNEPYFIGKVLTIFIAYFYFIIHFSICIDLKRIIEIESLWFLQYYLKNKKYILMKGSFDAFCSFNSII